MPLDIVVTNAGRAALINAENTGTAPATITEVGLSSVAVAPLPTLTALAGEFKRVDAVSGEVVADDTIHLSVMDFSGDSYTARSIGLYLADGTLFAIYGQADAIFEKTVHSDAGLSLDVIFADISAALLTFGDASFINPPATTERQGVVELATPAEAQAGIDMLRALTPATARTAILGWLLAQDGAGSGIDSDLLDGQQGAWYADIAARLGFTPLSRAGDAMTGPLALSGVPTLNQHAANKQYIDGLVTAAALLAKMLTVDGAGSGIDSDLLDGQHGAYYADIAARLGYTPANRAGDSFSGNTGVFRTGYAEVYANSHGAAIISMGAQSDGNVGLFVTRGAGREEILFATPAIIAMNKPVYRQGLSVWDAGNDGAGSGLDADMLDGFGSDAFARLIWHVGNSEAGGRMWSDGYKECWGTNSFAGDQTKTINYPFAFSSWSHAFLEGGFNSVGQEENGPFVISASTTGLTGMNAANASVSVFWRAYGY